MKILSFAILLVSWLWSSEADKQYDDGDSFFDLAFKFDLDVPKIQNMLWSVDRKLQVLSKDEAFPDTFQPVLHHWLNLIMINKDVKMKQSIIKIAQLAMEHGLDVGIPYRNDPPLYMKALITKELGLTRDVVSHGNGHIEKEVISKSVYLTNFLKTLYSIPADVIPVIKLLLHIEKLTIPKPEYEYIPNFNSTSFAIGLLEQARLDRPSIKANELFTLSQTYRDTIIRLAAHQNYSSIVTLPQVTNSLDEACATIQEALIEQVLSATERNLAIERLLDLHVQQIDQEEHVHRNAFHYLIMSRAVKMIEGVERLFLALSDDDSDAADAAAADNNSNMHSKSIIAQRILSQLHQPDHRQHTPYTYCIIRYGRESDICVAYMHFVKVVVQAAATTTTGIVSLSDIESQQLNWLAKIDPLFGLRNITTSSSATAATTTVETSQEGDSIEVVDDANLDTQSSSNNSGGGWNPTRLTSFDTNQCDILEIWNETLPNAVDFFNRFVNQGRPVIFRHAGIHPESKMKILQQVFEQNAFIKIYGKVKVDAAIIPYGGMLQFI